MSVQRRILSVEDVAVNRQLIGLFLASDSCAVDQAETGEEALIAVRARTYDLILMDLRLPGLDGLEVARCIRSMEGRGRRTPIVALTADVLPPTLAAAKTAGLDGHIAKPFTSATLNAEVSRWLDGSHQPEVALIPVLTELSGRFGRTIVSGLLSELMRQLKLLEDSSVSETSILSSRAHNIRGAAGTLGFREVAQDCADLEGALRRGEPVTDSFTRVVQACAAARATISAELGQAV